MKVSVIGSCTWSGSFFHGPWSKRLKLVLDREKVRDKDKYEIEDDAKNVHWTRDCKLFPTMNIITQPMSVVNYISVPDVKWKTTCWFLKKLPAGSSFSPTFVLEAWEWRTSFWSILLSQTVLNVIIYVALREKINADWLR